MRRQYKRAIHDIAAKHGLRVVKSNHYKLFHPNGALVAVVSCTTNKPNALRVLESEIRYWQRTNVNGTEQNLSVVRRA